MVEKHSHISLTSPHSHLGCLDTYHSDISICQVLHRKKVNPGHITISGLHFEHLHWSGITELCCAFHLPEQTEVHWCQIRTVW